MNELLASLVPLVGIITHVVDFATTYPLRAVLIYSGVRIIIGSSNAFVTALNLAVEKSRTKGML